MASLLGVLAVWAEVALWARGTCPSRCRCQKDIYGRREMRCAEGGLYSLEALLKEDESRESEVISVEPPRNYENHLRLSGVFRSYENLTELRLVRSNVATLDQENFLKMGKLRVLDLSFNRISLLTPSSFRGLSGLEALYVDHNRIESLPHGVFQHLSNLKVLSLVGNLLRELPPRSLSGLGMLHSLDLSENELRKLDPDVLEDARGLRYLRCRRCGLARVNQTSIRYEGRNRVRRLVLFRTLPDLEEVDFRDNRIDRLEVAQFLGLRQLRVVRLDGNSIASLPGDCFRGSDLILAGLSRNGLREMSPRAFAGSKLWQLDVSYNNLSRLGAESLASAAPDLRSLTLEGNALSLDSIKSSLAPLSGLLELNLANMRLTCLDDDLLKDLAALRLLNISRNDFKEIPAGLLANLKGMRVLDASHNRLRGIGEGLLRQIRAVDHVHLEGNTWVCDQCHVGALLPWLRTNRLYANACMDLGNASCLKCAAPYSLKGYALQLLDQNDLGPCIETVGEIEELTYPSQVGTALACVLVALLLAVLVALFLLYNRHAAHYYTHEEAPDGGKISTIDEMPPATKDVVLHFNGANRQ